MAKGMTTKFLLVINIIMWLSLSAITLYAVSLNNWSEAIFWILALILSRLVNMELNRLAEARNRNRK